MQVIHSYLALALKTLLDVRRREELAILACGRRVVYAKRHRNGGRVQLRGRNGLRHVDISDGIRHVCVHTSDGDDIACCIKSHKHQRESKHFGEQVVDD